MLAYSKTKKSSKNVCTISCQYNKVQETPSPNRERLD